MVGYGTVREGNTLGITGEDVGYRDAMRQIQKSLQRRLKTLEEDCKDASSDKQGALRIRISEVEHILQIVDSLHR